MKRSREYFEEFKHKMRAEALEREAHSDLNDFDNGNYKNYHNNGERYNNKINNNNNNNGQH